MSPHPKRARALPALAAVILCAVAAAGARDEPLDPEETRYLLKLMSSSPEEELKGMPGFTAEAARGVVGHRKPGKPFASIEEFRSASGLSEAQFARLAAFIREAWRSEKQEAAELKAAGEGAPGAAPPAAEAPPARPAGPAGKLAAPRKAGGAQGPLLDLEVKGGYYSILPGYDLAAVPEEKRRTFLDIINKEMCPCGCVGETLAWCLVNDPGCPVVKARVRKVYTDTVGSPPPAPPGR
jgi:hypothetical protein